VSGIAESRMLAFERDALACSGITAAGSCRAVGLIVAYGVLGTPRARIVRETLRDWFGMVRLANPHPELVHEIRNAWAKAKNKLRNSNNNINDVHGIMSNVIHMLIQAKWDPIAPNMWVDPEGNQWIIQNMKVAPDVVAAALTKSFVDIDLVRAAQHYNGKGLQEGLDTDNTFRYLRNIKGRCDLSYGYKGMLETIMSAAMWPATRISAINHLYPDICPRCHQEPETPLHTFWTCPCNEKIDEKYH
jgi:hypothetical protein